MLKHSYLQEKKLLINYFQKLSFTLTISKTISQHPSRLSPQVVLLMREMPVPPLYLLPKSSSHFSSHWGRSQPWLSILASVYHLIFNQNNVQLNLFSPLWRNLWTPSWFFDPPPSFYWHHQKWALPPPLSHIPTEGCLCCRAYFTSSSAALACLKQHSCTDGEFISRKAKMFAQRKHRTGLPRRWMKYKNCNLQVLKNSFPFVPYCASCTQLCAAQAYPQCFQSWLLHLLTCHREPSSISFTHTAKPIYSPSSC